MTGGKRFSCYDAQNSISHRDPDVSCRNCSENYVLQNYASLRYFVCSVILGNRESS